MGDLLTNPLNTKGRILMKRTYVMNAVMFNSIICNEDKKGIPYQTASEDLVKKHEKEVLSVLRVFPDIDTIKVINNFLE